MGFLVKRWTRQLQGNLQETKIKTMIFLLQHFENHQTMANVGDITMAFWFDGQNQHYYQQDPATSLWAEGVRI